MEPFLRAYHFEFVEFKHFFRIYERFPVQTIRSVSVTDCLLCLVSGYPMLHEHLYSVPTRFLFLRLIIFLLLLFPLQSLDFIHVNLRVVLDHLESRPSLHHPSEERLSTICTEPVFHGVRIIRRFFAREPRAEPWPHFDRLALNSRRAWHRQVYLLFICVDH